MSRRSGPGDAPGAGARCRREISLHRGALNLEGWIPIRVYWEGAEAKLDWVLLGGERFTDPFFEDTIKRRLYHPFHHAFRRRTGIDTLRAWQAERPGLPLAGFVLHMSRCGSTLMCQMLRALERNIVLSEPSPADSILRGHFQNPALTGEQRAEWLRWMLSALGQKRRPAEERVFVKFDAWHIAEGPVIRRAYPNVPWIFLYREPLEVLLSQINSPGAWTVPGLMNPATLGMDSADLAGIQRDEYCARLLGAVCRLALVHYRSGGGRLVNYAQLPEFVWSEMPGFFGFPCTPSDRQLMLEAARRDAKSPGIPFRRDGADRSAQATERLAALAAQWIEPEYRQLEAARRVGL